MSRLGRALGGAGAAIASLASKYIDDEIAQQRAEAMAALQVRTASTIREQDDAFRNDPTRLARDRETKRQDMLAAGSAAREAELAGVNDSIYQTAIRGKKDADAADDTRRKGDSIKALAPVQAEAEGQITGAREAAQTQAMKDRLPLEVQRAAATAEAQARASAKYRERPPGPAEKLADIEKVLGRPLQEPEKLALLGLGKDKSGATEEVVTEFDADGKPVGSKRTVKGPAGSGAAAAPADPAAQLRAGVDRARKDGKVAEAIAELRKRGATPAQILQAGVTEDELRSASQPTGDRPTPKAATREEYVPPADSIVGRHRARVAQEAAAREQDTAAKREQAAQAFSQLQPGDRVAAGKLQASELFALLSKDQQRAVYGIVNGR